MCALRVIFIDCLCIVFFFLYIRSHLLSLFFFLNNPPPPEFYPFPLHAPLPISLLSPKKPPGNPGASYVASRPRPRGEGPVPASPSGVPATTRRVRAHPVPACPAVRSITSSQSVATWQSSSVKASQGARASLTPRLSAALLPRRGQRRCRTTRPFLNSRVSV